MKTENTIGYSGFVKLKKMRGKQVVAEYNFHNNGTPYLFNVLSATLCGYNKLNDVPRYFDLGITSDGSTYTPCVPTRIAIVSSFVRNEKIDNDSIINVGAKFTIDIPSKFITSSEVNTFALYSSYQRTEYRTDLLAEVQLSEFLKLENTSNYSYIVEWIMTFSNATTNIGGNE